jgi:hypothetical protein
MKLEQLRLLNRGDIGFYITPVLIYLKNEGKNIIPTIPGHCFLMLGEMLDKYEGIL